MADIINAKPGTDPMAEHIKDVTLFVNHHLTAYIRNPPPGAQLDPMLGDLADQQPIDITHMKPGDTLTSFREAFRYRNAVNALGLVAMYEGAGNLFWFAVTSEDWKGKSLGDLDLTFTQLVAARTLFTQDALIGSSPDNERLQRLAFPVFLPSAVSDTKELKILDHGNATFKLDDIPLGAGLGTVIGWFDNMADALNASPMNHRYIKHLYEASRAVPIRLRLMPSPQTVQLDSLSYSETLRQAGTACVDSFWDFATKVTEIPPMHDVLHDKKKIIKEVTAAAERLKLRFKGKPVATSLASALKCLAPFVGDAACREAYKLLETVTSSLSEVTKLWRISQVADKTFSNFQPQVAAGAFRWRRRVSRGLQVARDGDFVPGRNDETLADLPAYR